MPDQGSMEKYWANVASKMLVGRRIAKVAYMDQETAEAIGFMSRPVVLVLDNGLMVYPSMDDEGNNGGALFTSDEKQPTLPVL